MQPSHNRNWWYAHNWITAHNCVDCGETDTRVLEFDHVRGTKEFNIMRKVPCVGFDRLKAEIEKCDVRCANCHTRRHYNGT